MDRDSGGNGGEDGTRGRSEVIGVVLLVGIVVLLAGLGLFIFDLSQTDVFFSKDGSGGILASESTLDDTHPGLDPGTEIRIVWNPEDADNSAILFEYEVESRS